LAAGRYKGIPSREKGRMQAENICLSHTRRPTSDLPRRFVGMADDERAYFAEGSADENIATSLKCAVPAAMSQHAARHTHTHTHAHTHAHVHCTCTSHTKRAHRTGDVLLINQRCMKLPPPAALLCWLSKFGISGDGRGCWDHAAFVLRDTKTDVPYLLEGGLSGATLRTYEERLLQNGGYREEMTLLPLHRAGSEQTGRAGSPADLARVDALLV
jgi:hypothetical protein